MVQFSPSWCLKPCLCYASRVFLVALETNWPFSYNCNKLCSLSWEPFWLPTQLISVCVAAEVVSNSVGACLSSPFCFLQHAEVITKQLTKNKSSLDSTVDRVGYSTFIPASSFILWWDWVGLPLYVTVFFCLISSGCELGIASDASVLVFRSKIFNF